MCPIYCKTSMTRLNFIRFFPRAMSRTGMCSQCANPIYNCKYTTKYLIYITINNLFLVEVHTFSDYIPNGLEILF